MHEELYSSLYERVRICSNNCTIHCTTNWCGSCGQVCVIQSCTRWRDRGPTEADRLPLGGIRDCGGLDRDMSTAVQRVPIAQKMHRIGEVHQVEFAGEVHDVLVIMRKRLPTDQNILFSLKFRKLSLLVESRRSFSGPTC